MLEVIAHVEVENRRGRIFFEICITIHAAEPINAVAKAPVLQRGRELEIAAPFRIVDRAMTRSAASSGNSCCSRDSYVRHLRVDEERAGAETGDDAVYGSQIGCAVTLE